MSHFDIAAQLIERFEGLRLEPYRCPAGILTVGYGHTGLDVREHVEITKDEAVALLIMLIGLVFIGVQVKLGVWKP